MRPVLLTLPLAGCFGFSDPPPERPAPALRKIEDAQLLDMKVHLYNQHGLCPGAEGKLYANANVQWPGAKPVVRTIGADVDSLHPNAFDIKGPLVTGDNDAHLHPNADVLKSVQVGFDATVVYKPNPKFTFHVSFPPEYSCYAGWFVDGAQGDGGGGGNYGDSGGEGQSGGPGGHGQHGGHGQNGGRITAYVTMVGTRYYSRLLAVYANDTFFLAPSDRALTFGAAGGQGGTGGNGGDGGSGGNQPTKDVTHKDDNGNDVTEKVANGPVGNGGSGGDGGDGGDGGNGGFVDVIYDSRFPELRGLVQTDVSGGAPGYGGAAGNGGSGGSSNADKGAQTGSMGEPGRQGRDGRAGTPGRASVRPGNVASRFDGLPGMATAGTPDVHKLQADKPKPSSQTISASGAVTNDAEPAPAPDTAAPVAPGPPPAQDQPIDEPQPKDQPKKKRKRKGGQP